MLKYPEKCKNLSHGQLVLVDVVCDYCGSDFSMEWRSRVKSQNKINKKDACPKCRMIKRKETTIMLYGVDNTSQLKEIKERSSKTRGGSGKCCEDYKEQIIEMYKTMSVNEIAKSLCFGRTALTKYMKEWGLDTKGDMQEKAQRTTEKRYGKKHFLQTDVGQQKLKQSFKEKYGYENPYENETFKKTKVDKAQKTSLERYGVESVLHDPNRKQELENKRKQTRIKNGQLIYDGKTVEELAKEKDICQSVLYERIRNFGFEEAIRLEKHHTTLELAMKDILDKNNIKYHTQIYIAEKIADFQIDNTNVLIEVDGIYWHSDIIMKDNLYHVKKRQLYIDNNFLPLFFREDEVLQKKDIVSSIIFNKLKINKTKIGARKCVIQEVDKDIANTFISTNHLMGIGQGRNFGLFYDNELVSCMSIKKGMHGFEISRFCNKNNFSVIGGFSKLLKFGMEKMNTKEITTFIDLRYGSGEYLKDMGFVHISTTPSFRWTNLRKCFNRMTFLGNSGYEQGYMKIWDCGQAKYILKLK